MTLSNQVATRASVTARLLLSVSLVGLFAAGCSHLPGPLASLGAPRPAWELEPPPPPEGRVVDPEAYHRLELPNGAVVMLLEDHRLPRVAMGVTVRRGAGDVAAEQSGLASLMAETMERGAGGRDALALAEVIDAIGGDLSVSASWDAVSVQVRGLARDLDVLTEVLTDVVLRPRFDRAEVAKARGEQLASLEQAKDKPERLVQWYTSRAVYGDHRYGKPLGGTQETVGGLDHRATQQLHARYFVPSNAILWGVGDLDPAEFERRMRTAFGEWSGGEAPPVGEAPAKVAPAARKVVLVDRPDLGQARIVVAHDGIARADEQRVGADLVNDVLGGSGFSSRLMASLRAEAGLTYSVWSGFGLRRHPGPFLSSTFTRVPETRRAIDMLLEEIDAIGAARPVTDEELAKAKSFSIGNFGLGLETSDAVLSSLVDFEVHGLPADSLDTYRSRVRAIGVDDAATLADRFFQPERAAIVVLGPAEKLQPQLEGLGPIEVVEP